METANDRRLRKLKALIEEKGGVEAVATAASISAQSLDQILKGTLLPKKADGTRSKRSLGDAAAWEIEDAYGLGRGWFDMSDAASEFSAEARAFAKYYDGASSEQRVVFKAVAVVAGIAPISATSSKQSDKKQA